MKKDKKIDEQTLGDRMKHYEGLCETKIDPSSHIIVRVDGHKFSSFSKGFKKPFDEILSRAMELTTQDLLDEFNAYTAYTQSDEITLVIPSLQTTDRHKGTNAPQWKHAYSGRVQKMSSLIAGFTTMRFNLHLKSLIENSDADGMDDTYWWRLADKIGNAWFDCRVYGVESDEEAFNSIMWRVRDCIKNSRSMYAQTHCSHKQLQGKTGPEQVQYCLEKTGNDWNLIDDRYKYGIIVKKELYMKTVQNGDRNNKHLIDMSGSQTVQRARIVSYSKCLTTFDDKYVKEVMSKHIIKPLTGVDRVLEIMEENHNTDTSGPGTVHESFDEYGYKD